MTKITKEGKKYKVDEYFHDGKENRHLLTMTNVTLLELCLYLEKSGIDFKVISHIARNMHANHFTSATVEENGTVCYGGISEDFVSTEGPSSVEHELLLN